MRLKKITQAKPKLPPYKEPRKIKPRKIK